MWQLYRQRIILKQLFILGMCAVGWFYVQMPVENLLLFFLLMQFALLSGAWWAQRLKRKMESRSRNPFERNP